MKLYRCRICGETYLGSEKPSHCPFCGAHAELIVLTEEYPEDVNRIQPIETERADLETSIELERSNTRFYLAMAARKDNPKLANAYKRLAKIEGEHCSLFCKLAGTPKPADLMEAGDELGSWDADIDDSLRREIRASAGPPPRACSRCGVPSPPSRPITSNSTASRSATSDAALQLLRAKRSGRPRDQRARGDE
jgi:predicted  nucleic acid-binding Zn-ribbon protein